MAKAAEDSTPNSASLRTLTRAKVSRVARRGGAERRGVTKGMAMVFRGADALGTVQYTFTLHDGGRVTGTVVHVDPVPVHPGAPRVPANALPPSAVKTDLYLRLSDGTAVDFLIADTTGRIANGRCRQEH
jgi:hypothetical protein